MCFWQSAFLILFLPHMPSFLSWELEAGKNCLLASLPLDAVSILCIGRQNQKPHPLSSSTLRQMSGFISERLQDSPGSCQPHLSGPRSAVTVITISWQTARLNVTEMCPQSLYGKIRLIFRNHTMHAKLLTVASA